MYKKNVLLTESISALIFANLSNLSTMLSSQKYQNNPPDRKKDMLRRLPLQEFSF